MGTILRVSHAVKFLPIRFLRLTLHLSNWVGGGKKMGVDLPMNRFYLWWLEFGFYLLDFLAIPEIYETLMDWGKWKTRPLTDEELALARSVFGGSILYERVRVDEAANIVCRKRHVFYVSFYTINSWGQFCPDIFIHEMMHIWQFQNMGGVYIPRALLAQRTAMGYNYGGLENLLEAKKAGGGFEYFNLEQQADIVSDYFCIREGLMPRWCQPQRVGTYETLGYFIKQLQSNK